MLATTHRPANETASKTPAPAVFVGKCKRCKTAARFEAPVVRTYIAQLGYGRTERRTWRAAPWGTEQVNNDGSISVRCLCGGTAWFYRLIGRVTKQKCGARCMSSTGHVCDCSCGGHNHGRGFEMSVAS